jgi:uncharacterized protein YndB with AHSA1/START domain
MESFQITQIINASPEEVYQAFTTEKGLKSWWTRDCDVGENVGDIHHFRFENDIFNKMEILELTPYKKIHWKCIDGWDEWTGTEVLIDFFPTDEGKTRMFFRHKGLTPDLICYSGCHNSWTEYIKEIIKTYIETGLSKKEQLKKNNVTPIRKA